MIYDKSVNAQLFQGPTTVQAVILPAPWPTGRWNMRRSLDALIWLLVFSTVSGAYCLVWMTPDAEAMLGLPACAGLPHTGPCRLCPRTDMPTLPPVIDGNNVHFVSPAARSRR
jgi:hypothetical protein